MMHETAARGPCGVSRGMAAPRGKMRVMPSARRRLRHGTYRSRARKNAGDAAARSPMWLLLCCALVFAMVVVGGVTRLTHSGLSIVEWQPIVGTLPPLSDARLAAGVRASTSRRPSTARSTTR